MMSGRIVLLHEIDRLGVALHVVAVDLVVAEQGGHRLARHLVVVHRIQLGDHQRPPDELRPNDLAVGRKDVHHVRSDLAVLVPQHGIDVEMNGRVTRNGHQRIAYRLEVGAVDTHVAESFDNR